MSARLKKKKTFKNALAAVLKLSVVSHDLHQQTELSWKRRCSNLRFYFPYLVNETVSFSRRLNDLHQYEDHVTRLKAPEHLTMFYQLLFSK